MTICLQCWRGRENLRVVKGKKVEPVRWNFWNGYVQAFLRKVEHHGRIESILVWRDYRLCGGVGGLEILVVVESVRAENLEDVADELYER